MKTIIPLLSAAVMILSSCSNQTSTSSARKIKEDAATNKAWKRPEGKKIYAAMQIKNSIKIGDSVKLKFTVYNPTDSVQQFCKWHTPFEPLISKYLDVKEVNGEEANYQGAMAKRMMPPPASSYQKVNPGDSLSIAIDLLKGYAVKKPGKYVITYNGEGMSGLSVKDSVVFNYVKP